MKNTVFLSLVVVGIFLLSGFGVLAQAPGIQINLSKPRAVESYVVESAHPYTNNYDYTWTITKTGASTIRVHFYQYETESGYDYIYILDRDGNQLARYGGATTTNVWSPWSNSDTIKVRLYTDYSVTKWGFKIDQWDYTTSSQNDAGSGTDAGNTLDTALQINPGSYSGYMDSADGNDYYKFNVNSGQTIQVSMTPPSGVDFDLKLYNPSNTEKASSTAGAGTTDSVTFTADSSGYWRARIYYYSGSGTYSFTVSVTGGSGGTLGDAVDNTALTWTTGGNANWAVDTSTYYYGTSSAKSGTITHSQNTYIQTTVTGPGTLTFYWKVSSESNYDYLRFYIDGTEQTKISGSVSWAQKSYSISSGSHTLQWKYTKDGSVSSGSDCGWLDKVVFTGGDTTPPVISSVQSSSITSSGATITWTTDEASSSVVEYGTTTSYGSTATGSNGVTSHSVSLSGLTAGTTYHYRVKSADSSGNTATSGDYTFTTTAASSDIELTSGVAYSDSLSATNDKDYYKINVPSGSTKLEVILDGPASGCDFDLYVKYNQRPTTSSYDGRGYTSSSDETVTINSPSTGYYYIMPYSYSGSGSYSIKATVTGGGGSSGSKYAVIVGINDYNYISDLSYCVNDANDWKPYLEGQGYIISSFLTNSQATETAIKNAIANAISQAGSTGTVAFIFAGHGGKYSEAGLSGEGSICYCYDGSGSSGTSGNLQDTELQTVFSGYTGKLFIFLDSCRSGGMNEVINSANRYMATTCSPNGYGYDEPSYSNGAWTYWFLEKGIVNSGSGHTDMEGNFNWAKNNYPYTGDDAPMQFDGDTSSLFYL
ncbi:MAG: pre-peptidase C-terminal domain-containing protein [Candidatus Thermoplasmatota archaeon]|nr:pre-peptidase C-terminal domain-containing protein [Candidatus Thermoplasmatota archaeon]